MKGTEQVNQEEKNSEAYLGLGKTCASLHTLLLEAFTSPVILIAVVCQFINNTVTISTFTGGGKYFDRVILVFENSRN